MVDPDQFSYERQNKKRRKVVREADDTVADDPSKVCSICREPFETYWDEQHEEWMYRNAVKRINNSELETIHIACDFGS